MRPKKSLLLLCPDSGRGSELSFVLRCHGYRVFNCEQDVRADNAVDGVLVVLGAERSTSSVVSQLKELAIRRTPPILLIWEGGDCAKKAARPGLGLNSMPMVDLIGFLRVMLQVNEGQSQDPAEQTYRSQQRSRCDVKHH